MKAAIHYVVKGKFIRCTTADQIDFVQFEEVFEDEIPIHARERAFDFFDSYIDVLIDSKENVCDRFKPQYSTSQDLSITAPPPINKLSTLEEFEKHIELYKEYYNNSSSSFREHVDIYNGIGIFLVMNVPIYPIDIETTDFQPEDYPIFGIDFNGDVFYPEVLIDGLTSEFDYYNHFKFETKDYAIKAIYHYSGAPKPEEVTILKTPFDWEELFIQESNQVPDIETIPLQGDPILPNILARQPIKASTLQIYSSTPESVRDILLKGEGKQIEYKSTLLFNPATNKGGISKKGVIAKTICSFLNSLGGFLFIGINDKGIPIGLDSDFSLSNKSDPQDFFKLEFDEMIYHFFGRDVHEYINGDFVDIDGKVIFLVTVSPSILPVFMAGQESKMFYIRGTASSQLLTDIEEITKYCLAHKNFIKS
jgi:hypothetical protein